ncbi:MAG: PAS domain-containing sensor histidine kinase [Thiohalomonadales bacterium]
MSALQPINQKELKESFQKFNQLSKSLEFSYQHLETHLSHLHRQLEDAKSQNAFHSNQNQQFSDRLNAILNVLPAGIVVLDEHGLVQDCNPAAQGIFARPLLQKRWIRIVEQAFEVSPDAGNDVVLKNGRKVNLATCPLGSYPGQVIMINDVTETRKLEDKLNQHKRLNSMGEMAASLAHQLRTPIATGILYGSQLKNRHLDEAKRVVLVDKVIAQMRDLEKIVSNMLVFSRGHIQGMEKCGLLDLVTHVVEGLQQTLIEKDISVDIRFPEAEVMVFVNRSTMQSAIQNVLVNAMQAIETDGEIVFSVDDGPVNSVEMKISDNGIGISLDRAAEIFDPFVTDKANGTGLGLAVVLAIARAHNGDFYLRESQVGVGSTFEFRLPSVVSE